MKQKHFIDSHKGFNAFAILGLLAYFGAWENTALWVYLALHGTYGFLWVLKSRVFGDKQWEQPCSPFYGVLIWGALSLYWVVLAHPVPDFLTSHVRNGILESPCP